MSPGATWPNRNVPMYFGERGTSYWLPICPLADALTGEASTPPVWIGFLLFPCLVAFNISFWIKHEASFSWVMLKGGHIGVFCSLALVSGPRTGHTASVWRQDRSKPVPSRRVEIERVLLEPQAIVTLHEPQSRERLSNCPNHK